MRLNRDRALHSHFGAYVPTPGNGEVSARIREIERKALRDGLADRPYPFHELDAAVATEITARWKQPCEAMFEHLAQCHPDQLLRLVNAQQLPPIELSFAAEAAGTLANSPAVRNTLLRMLRHGDAVVREGAIYGLARHVDEEILRELRQVAATDPSPGVQEAAANLIE